MIEFKVKIPLILLLITIALPLIAYADVSLIGKYNYFQYLFVCAVEVFLVYVGFIWGLNSQKQRKEKSK